MDFSQHDDPLGAAIAADQADPSPLLTVTPRAGPPPAATVDDPLGDALARDAAASQQVPGSAHHDDDLLGAALARDASAMPPPSTPQTAAAPPPSNELSPAFDDNGNYAYQPNIVSPDADIRKATKEALDLNEKVAQGVTMGFAPRLGALADSDPLGKALGLNPNAPSYADALAQRNATDARISTEYPTAAPIAEGVGSVLGMAIPGGAAADAVRGAPTVGRIATGAATGAALGGVQGAARSKDLTDLSQTSQEALAGAGAGTAFGAGLPVLGAAVGAGYRAAAPFFGAGAPEGMSRTAAGLLANATNPNTVDRLASLGPQGMLADTSPSALGLAQGVATRAGPAADTVVNSLANRAAGQSDRLLSSVDENLGPAFSPRQVGQMMGDRQAAASPMYQAALGNAPNVDITPVMQQLENARLFAKGTDAQRLDRFGQLLQGPQRVNGVAMPEYDANALHRAKMEMDAQIEGVNNQTGSAAATATRDMVGVRSALNNALETQVPGYAAANLAYRTAARGGEAFDAGRQALKPGADTLWPTDLDHQFATMPLEQQALMRAGARSDIAAGMGNNPNDLSALSKVLGGDNDFNRQKAATLFGPEQAQSVVRDVGNERTFADTYNKVVQNTQTAQRLDNSAAIRAAEAPAQLLIPKTASGLGMLGHAAEFAIRKGFGALAKSTGDATRDQLARALIAQGPIATQNTQALARALLNHQANSAAISAAGSNPAALAAALAGYRETTRP